MTDDLTPEQRRQEQIIQEGYEQHDVPRSEAEELARETVEDTVEAEREHEDEEGRG